MTAAPFTQGHEEYRSDIKLGRKYRDTQTGVEGIATSLHFFQHACERVVLEFVHDGRLREYSFDAPRLVAVDEPAKPVRQQATGGPERNLGQRR